MSITRRHFLAQSTALAAGTLAFPRRSRAQAPSDRLRLAFIGVGGRGARNLKDLTVQGDEVVALCDVDKRHLARQQAEYPQAKTYTDFRALYDNAEGIDAFVVSVPEHTHAYATLPALRLGKPVYCEKPLTLNVHEARLITDAAREAGVATQMGTQNHGGTNYRRVVELVQSGAIGPVREAHVWVSRAWGLQSREEAEANNDIVYVADRPEGSTPIPDGLDWDLWLGPRSRRPFHEVYFPGPKWYRWWDFGNGTMSDLGSHWNDLPFWALKLEAPQTIEAHGIDPHPEIAPASMTAVYEYGPREGMPACKLHWHQGTHKPAIWTEGDVQEWPRVIPIDGSPDVRVNWTHRGGIPQWPNGVLFIGDNGMLLSDYSKHVLLPEEKFVDFQRPEPFIPDSPGQHVEWLNACKHGTPTGSPFNDYAGLLTEANHLGNVAYRAGRKIEWDSANLRIPNAPEAERFLRRENPRPGWDLV